jgi:hypothetical protein
MGVRLDKTAVKRWLRGQQEAMRRIEGERFRVLLQMTPEESYRIYLSLESSSMANGRDTAKPSPVLWSMRQILRRYERARMRSR